MEEDVSGALGAALRAFIESYANDPVGFVRQVLLLTRGQVDVVALRVGQRVELRGTQFAVTDDGVGTGGHLTGTAKVLKAKWPHLKVYAVEPTASPVISGGAPAPHPIQGIGAGFIPKNLDTALLDGVIQVEADAAREMGRRSAAEEGLLVGISSGATLAAIAQKLPEIPEGATVLGFNYDTGERYLSVEGYLPV